MKLMEEVAHSPLLSAAVAGVLSVATFLSKTIRNLLPLRPEISPLVGCAELSAFPRLDRNGLLGILDCHSTQTP